MHERIRRLRAYDGGARLTAVGADRLAAQDAHNEPRSEYRIQRTYTGPGMTRESCARTVREGALEGGGVSRIGVDLAAHRRSYLGA